MILAGFVIALGAVVDDAIIDVENIVRRLRQHRAGGQHRPRRRRSSSTPRSRCASAIVYATLIDVVAVMPVFFIEGLSGAFFQPLGAVVRAGDAGLDGGGADASRRRWRPAAPSGSASSGASRRSCGGSSGLSTQRLLAPNHPLAAPGVRRRSARCCLPASLVLPALGQSLLPDFKERDFLMHWLTTPGTSQSGDGPDQRGGQQRAAHDPRRPQLRRAHRPGADHATRSSASTSARTGSASTRSVDYDETLAAVQEVVDGYPGPLPRRADLPEGADPRGADRARATRSWCASSAPTCHLLRERRTRSRSAMTGRSTGSSTCMSSSRSRSRRSTVKVDLADGPAVRAQAR